MSLSFLKDFNSSINKMGNINTSSAPPSYWFSSGNYVLNKILSGSFKRAVPQGRIIALCGLSGVGKSFLAGNFVKAAQDEGAFILVLDSENALDDDYMSKLKVDTSPDRYFYTDPTTIPQASKIISTFTKGYRSDYGTDSDAPKILIVIDSLDMLMTATELETYQKGQTSGDQGQQAKQLKSLLKTITQDIKTLNISVVVTKQVYKAQGMFQTEPYVITEAVKYSSSQILILNKLKLRNEQEKTEVEGIRMQVEVYKTRFTKPFQKVEINVPYETGMDPYSGLLEVAEALGVIKKVTTQSWSIKGEGDTKFTTAKLKSKEMLDKILDLCEESDSFIMIANDEDIDEDDVVSAKVKRSKKGKELAEAMDVDADSEVDFQ
jgi:recombination protein RecA